MKHYSTLTLHVHFMYCKVTSPITSISVSYKTHFLPAITSMSLPLQEDQTPLHIASRLGKTEIVQLLLQHMAHPDASTTNGYTPLHISAREGQVDVASVLLEAGASHSLATKVGGEHTRSHTPTFHLPTLKHTCPTYTTHTCTSWCYFCGDFFYGGNISPSFLVDFIRNIS